MGAQSASLSDLTGRLKSIAAQLEGEGWAVAPVEIREAVAIIEGHVQYVFAEVAKIVEGRKSVYVAKADAADPFAPDTLNLHEKYAFAAEALDHILVLLASNPQGSEEH